NANVVAASGLFAPIASNTIPIWIENATAWNRNSPKIASANVHGEFLFRSKRKRRGRQRIVRPDRLKHDPNLDRERDRLEQKLAEDRQCERPRRVSVQI